MHLGSVGKGEERSRRGGVKINATKRGVNVARKVRIIRNAAAEEMGEREKSAAKRCEQKSG